MLQHKPFALILIFGWIASSIAWSDDDLQAIKIQALYQIQSGTREGRVVLLCNIPEGHHIYSTQQASPPGPTKIKIADSDKFKLTAGFTPDRKPAVIEHDPVFETRLELFDGKVAFTAPLQLTGDAELEKLAIELTINCQVCSNNECVIVRNKKIEVRFGGYFDPEAEKKAQPSQSPKGSTGGKDD